MLSPSKARSLLKTSGLRCTQARLDVVCALAAGNEPLSHKDACERLPDMDRITVFRNLVALTEAGLATRLDLGDRVWRYALTPTTSTHVHPHFTCTSCGEVQCLDEVRVETQRGAAWLLEGADVQIRGVCGGCR